MTLGIDLKPDGEGNGNSAPIDNSLDGFAAEDELGGAPPAADPVKRVLLVRDPFITDSVLTRHPVRPRPRVRRALTILVLMAAGWGAYKYEVHRRIDLDAVTAWASRVLSPPDRGTTAPDTVATAPDTATTAPAITPGETRKDISTPTDSLPARDPRAASLEADRTADKRSSAPEATASTTARPSAARPERTGTSGVIVRPVQDVSGAWRLTRSVATTSGVASEEYQMTLTQENDRVTGVGRKISENEKDIDPRAHTPLALTGTIAGDRLTMTFVERDDGRETHGKFVLLIDEGGTLRGRFSSNAARSSGLVEARRVSSAQ